MERIVFQPSKKFLLELYIGGFFLAPFLFLVWSAVAHSRAAGLLLTLLLLGPAVLFSYLYFHSLKYEINDREIIVYSGVLTKYIKHVPFRTVTNLQVRRGPLDRMLGLGSLDIQTAGASGTSIPEERLVGLDNVQVVYEYIANELRRFQFGMSPTQADQDTQVSLGTAPNYDQELLRTILEELRAIRSRLEQG